jgi:hypothetical protein
MILLMSFLHSTYFYCRCIWQYTLASELSLTFCAADLLKKGNIWRNYMGWEYSILWTSFSSHNNGWWQNRGSWWNSLKGPFQLWWSLFLWLLFPQLWNPTIASQLGWGFIPTLILGWEVSGHDKVTLVVFSDFPTWKWRGRADGRSNRTLILDNRTSYCFVKKTLNLFCSNFINLSMQALDTRNLWAY